jgi:hypothetical protein
MIPCSPTDTRQTVRIASGPTNVPNSLISARQPQVHSSSCLAHCRCMRRNIQLPSLRTSCCDLRSATVDPGESVYFLLRHKSGFHSAATHKMDPTFHEFHHRNGRSHLRLALQLIQVDEHLSDRDLRRVCYCITEDLISCYILTPCATKSDPKQAVVLSWNPGCG